MNELILIALMCILTLFGISEKQNFDNALYISPKKEKILEQEMELVKKMEKESKMIGYSRVEL